MKITDVEAIALVWPASDREYWTALRPIGRVSEVQVHGHIVAGLEVGEICETFPSADRDPIWEELFTVRPEISGGKLTLNDRPGWDIELDERTLERRGTWA